MGADTPSLTPTPGMRNAVRALIVRDDALLVQHKVYENGTERFALPGGAVAPGETLAEGLVRECQEELGTDVAVLDLLFVADYWKPRDTDPPTERQQVEFVFAGRVAETYEAQNGPNPDKNQKSVIWLPWAEIGTSKLKPQGIRDCIVNLGLPRVRGVGNPPLIYQGRIE